MGVFMKARFSTFVTSHTNSNAVRLALFVLTLAAMALAGAAPDATPGQ